MNGASRHQAFRSFRAFAEAACPVLAARAAFKTDLEMVRRDGSPIRIGMNTIRADDTVCRRGGHEFVMMLAALSSALAWRLPEPG
jgi:hypothetical protein